MTTTGKTIDVNVGTVKIKIPEHVLAAALEMQVAKYLEEDPYFQTWLRKRVEHYYTQEREKLDKVIEQAVAEQAPFNLNMHDVIDSVKQHLDRYPLIGNDKGLQDAVGVAIFNWLQKPST